MPVVDVYQTINASHWNILVPLYFFMLSLSAGVILVLALGDILKLEIPKSLKQVGYLVGLVAIGVAPVFIIMDLGQPLRFLSMMNPGNFQITSPMSWGGWLLILYGLGVLFTAKNHLLSSGSVSFSQAAAASEAGKTGSWIMLVLALMVAAYPGVELGVVKAIPLWNSDLLPVYFISTTFLAGAAIMGLLLPATRQTDGNVAEKLGQLLSIFIAVSLVWIVFRTVVLSGAGGHSSEAISALWKNSVFLGGELVAGLLIPLALLIFGGAKSKPGLLAVASALVILGVFCMRYALIFVGLGA